MNPVKEGFSETNTSSAASFQTQNDNFEKHIPVMHYGNQDSISLTTLPNGITVASVDNHTNAGVVTVQFKRAGMMYDSFKGISVLMNKLAFKASRNYNHDQLQELHDRIMYESMVDYENKDYSATFVRYDLDEVIPLLADNILHPLFEEQDIAESLSAIHQQIEEELNNPAISTVFNDQMLEACFGKNQALGQPTLTAPDTAITSDHLYAYNRSVLRPENCVIVGVGVDHQKFVQLCEKHFVFSENVPLIEPQFNPDVCEWRGGDARYEFTGTALDFHRQNIPTLTSVGVGFKSAGYMDMKVIPALVLETILGGGDSFSAGGPGKGLQTVIHKDMLPNYPLHGMVANHQVFEKNGIFMIQASSTQEYVSYVPYAIMELITSAIDRIKEEDVERGKNRFQSLILTQLEHPRSLAQSIAGDLLYYGKYRGVEFMRNHVSEVTLQDVQRTWKDLLAHPAGTAVVGLVNEVPPRQEFDRVLEATRQGVNQRVK